MKKFTFLFVAYLFVIFNLSAQDAANSVVFTGENPKLAIAGGKVILNVDLKVVDAQPNILMLGLAKLDSNNVMLGGGPINFEMIFLTDVAPYSKNISDTVSVPADLPLSTSLGEGEKYAYFASILTSAFAPLQIVYSDMQVVDVSFGNNVNFSPLPVATVIPASNVLVGVDLTVVDSQPAFLMLGLVKVDTANNLLGGPIVNKILFMTGEAPYSKHVTDTVGIPADLPLSSSLGEGERYAYFTSILSSSFTPLQLVVSPVTVKEAANSVTFSPIPVPTVTPASDVLIGVDINAVDAQPAFLMLGLVKVDTANNLLTGPIVNNIIFISGEAPYSQHVADTVSIPADLPLSSSLAEGERYAYFASILSSSFAPLQLIVSVVTVSTTTSVNEQFMNRLMVYPNPVMDRLYIAGIQQNEKFEIYNIEGKLELKIIASNNGIDVSGLKSGIYLIKGKSFASKFIKK
ncbi:hypothetical protein MASR2M47_41560 [Draconibacterium sp.]|jgi:hypothetical protein